MINEVKEWSLFIAALLCLCRRFLDIKWIGVIGGIFFGIFVIITFYQMCAKYKNEKKIKPLFKTFWIDLIIIFPPITIIVLLVFFLLERCA